MSELTDHERALLAPHVSNLDGPVFALTGLAEVVKGAMFARYSRSPKPLRRLLLDEFADALAGHTTGGADEGTRAAALYDRVFLQYGDDSVAQLGGAHLAVEGASNLLTKQLEWGRLAAYLEQSTRYISYDDKPGGRYRYHRPREILTGPHAQRYTADLDWAFDTYASLIPPMTEWASAVFPQDPGTPDRAYRNSVRAKALDSLRGLLPAATTSNVGIFASGQAYENMLLRLAGHELTECRDTAAAMLTELRSVIPSFLKRVDLPDRGVCWTRYLNQSRSAAERWAGRLAGDQVSTRAPAATLAAYGPDDAEIDLVAGILYPHTHLSEEALRTLVTALDHDVLATVVNDHVGQRSNRRHRPGRAFERPWYRFDVLSDYGAFRDLQRHRMLTIQWQLLTPVHGYSVPVEVDDAGLASRYDEVLERQASLYDLLVADHGPVVAQYAVGFGFDMRYSMQMNARAAMQMLELRTTPQGHPSYRRVCQQMHTAIGQVHPLIGQAMTFVDHSAGGLERLESERRMHARSQA